MFKNRVEISLSLFFSDDEADSQTEGEELARAREMRMQEVKLMPPPTLPTDTETEVSRQLADVNPVDTLFPPHVHLLF